MTLDELLEAAAWQADHGHYGESARLLALANDRIRGE